MQCACHCHNPLIEKADHIETACPKCVTGSIKECNETEHLVKEKLLRLCRLDDCLQEIVAMKDIEDDDKMLKIFALAEAALTPTILCLSCRGLTTVSPCENCGS